MRVLLRLGRAQLRDPTLGQHLAQDLRQALGRKRRRHVDLRVVAGHGRERRQLRAGRSIEVREVGVRRLQREGELARAIGAEIVEEAGVAVLDHGARAAVRPLAHQRHDELVGERLRRLVAALDRVGEVVDPLAFTAGEHLPGDLQPVPALVAIHGVVTADRRHQLADADLLQPLAHLAQIAGRRGGRRIAPVQEGVPRDPIEAAPLGQLAHRVGVIQRGVHVARAGQPEQVQRAAARLGGLNRRDQPLILVERAVGDRLVDAHDVLIDDAARAQVEVSDLAVAHLPVGQPDVVARGADQHVRVALVQLGEGRHARQSDGVPVGFGALAETIQDDEDDARHGAHAP